MKAVMMMMMTMIGRGSKGSASHGEGFICMFGWALVLENMIYERMLPDCSVFNVLRLYA